MRGVRWLRAEEYSINALKMGTGSMASTLHSTAQHSQEKHSTALITAHNVIFVQSVAHNIQVLPLLGVPRQQQNFSQQCIGMLLRLSSALPLEYGCSCQCSIHGCPVTHTDLQPSEADSKENQP